LSKLERSRLAFGTERVRVALEQLYGVPSTILLLQVDPSLDKQPEPEGGWHLPAISGGRPVV
jgi:hypothetical protein